ncbi:MAG TPA: cobalt ECF transporter T component CbiQ [Candidatus Brocadiales bacterium]|nr:cobalt ECF transporter T component CbiQ [Candidatus Brocadiales bacterium]
MGGKVGKSLKQVDKNDVSCHYVENLWAIIEAPMGFDIFEKYKDRNNLIYRLDPRTKLIFSLVFLISMVLTPIKEIERFGFYFALILIIIFIARISPVYVFKRSVIVIPFILVVAGLAVFFTEGRVIKEIDFTIFKLRFTYEGISILLNALVKSWLSVVALTTIMLTTRFEDLLRGVELLKAPQIIVIMMSFMYRYIFVLIDEAAHLMQARNIRYFGGRFLSQIPVLGNMVGILFIRTYERAERIYAAMAVRGFTGQMRSINTLKFSFKDAIFLMITFVLLGLCQKL